MEAALRTASLRAAVTERHYTQQTGGSLPMCLGPRVSRLGPGAMITGCVRCGGRWVHGRRSQPRANLVCVLRRRLLDCVRAVVELSGGAQIG